MESYINIDKNMIVNTTIGDAEVTWYDVRRAPFSLHGLYEPRTEAFFHRLPLDVAAATSEAVDRLSQESAGGRVRFSTDSPYIASSYLKARQAGDENVYFIDGMSFFVEPHQYDFSMDGVHPNDAGFHRMADGIGTVIRHIFEKGM